MTPGIIQELIDRGVDVNAKAIDGLTALDHARRLGRAPIVDVLWRAGVDHQPRHRRPRQFVARHTVAAAVKRSLPLLQASSKTFYDRGGCVGCHHNLHGRDHG